MGVVKFDKSRLDKNNLWVHQRHKSVGYEMHRHEYFELLCYRGCLGITRINGKSYNITDNCIFLLTPTDFHEIEAEEIEGSHSTVVSFSGDIIDENLLSGGAMQPRVLYGADDYLISCFEKMHEHFRSKDASAAVKIYHLINYALAEISENGQTLSADNSYIHPKIREAVTYVLSNIDADTTLVTVAERVKLSPSYFSAKFSEVMGKPYKLWLTEIKLERAKRMLESTSEDIITVAYECGYNNPSHFIKIFGEAVGMTPKRYRRAFLEK